MKIKTNKKKHRICPYCNKYIPNEYNFAEHKKLCRNVNDCVRPHNLDY